MAKDGSVSAREFALPEEPPAIVFTERLDAPLERVWTVRWEPLYVAHWWRPEGYVNHIVEVELEVGGHWRVVQRDPQGNEFAFYGAFTEVEPLRRVVQTHTAELFPGVHATVATEFREVDGLTVVRTTHLAPSPEARAGLLAHGEIDRMHEASLAFEELLHSFG